MTRYAELKALVQKWRDSAKRQNPWPGLVSSVTADTLLHAAQELEAALALPEDSEPFAWFHRETGALRFTDLQQMADARNLPQVETPLYLAPPKDGKTVNAELYGLAVELADDAAKAAIECLCMVDKPGSNTHVLIGRQTRHGPYVDLAARYLSLREASGEPMPYKVVRDGDKVRFL